MAKSLSTSTIPACHSPATPSCTSALLTRRAHSTRKPTASPNVRVVQHRRLAWSRRLRSTLSTYRHRSTLTVSWAQNSCGGPCLRRRRTIITTHRVATKGGDHPAVAPHLEPASATTDIITTCAEWLELQTRSSCNEQLQRAANKWVRVGRIIFGQEACGVVGRGGAGSDIERQ